MRVLYAFLLQIFHFIYVVILLVRSFWKRNSAAAPQPLRASRPRIPKHLAVLFNVDPSVSEEIAKSALTESVIELVSWCRAVGIQKLTVYEEGDLLSKCDIRERLPVRGRVEDSSESEMEYPLTPPASDYSESRPLSPDTAHDDITPVTMIKVTNSVPRKGGQTRRNLHRRRHNPKNEDVSQNDLLLCLASRKCSKSAIARAATDLARTHSRQHPKNSRSSTVTPYRLTVVEFDQILEDEDGLSSPDFMIIHPIGSSGTIASTSELHGFPPWHIRLTEIYQNKPPKSRLQQMFRWQSSPVPAALDETSFRSALDEFASAEMRFGK